MGMMKIIEPILHSLVSPSSSLGLEITDQAIKIVEIKVLKNKRPLVLKMVMEKLPKQVVVDGRIKDVTRLLLIMQTLIAKHSLKHKKIHMVIPSQTIMVRFLKLPDIPDVELRKVVDFEVKHNIHLPFEEPYFDFCKLNGINDKKRAIKKVKKQDINKKAPAEDLFMNEAAAASESNLNNLFSEITEEGIKDEGLQCDVMLVAAPKEIIEEYNILLQSSGLTPISIEIKALSLFRLIKQLTNINSKSTFLLVDINENITDLSIFHDEQLKITRTVPLEFADKTDQSSNETDSSLAFLGFHDADADFNEARNELAHELERLINFYRYTLNNRNQEFDHIVISGDVSRLHEICTFVEEKLSLKVVVPVPNSLAFSENNYDFTTKTLFSVPLGLALRGKAT
ncbi:MAG: Tfp pilus assembly protein ATPase PilM [Paenibacillus sp.]|nr:Tfp pilus assembly protein ATPase PilM [Paenibacillus sp.]